MPDRQPKPGDRQPKPGDRPSAQREADHASLARLSETLVPALVAKLNASGLGELEVREGDWRVRLRRPPGPPAPAAGRRHERSRTAGHGLSHGPERDAARALRGAASVAPLPDRGADSRRGVATSPAVGVFRPGPAIGTRVRTGDRIAIVDLLGIPLDVVSPIDGTLVEVFAQAGEAVEFGEQIAAVEADPVPEPVVDDGADSADEPAGED